MAKPDSEEFARTLLWHLACLRAELAELRMDIIEHAKQISAAPPHEDVQKWKEKNRDLRVRLYREALKDVGLSEKKDFPRPSDLPDELGRN